MGARNTGVFATSEEVEQAKAAMAEAARAPVVLALGRVDVKKEMTDMAMEVIDRAAYAHGLPDQGKDPDGDQIHYGMLLTGEFTAWDGEL